MQELQRVLGLAGVGCIWISVDQVGHCGARTDGEHKFHVEPKQPMVQRKIRKFVIDVAIKYDEVDLWRDLPKNPAETEGVEEIEKQAGCDRIPGDDILVATLDRVVGLPTPASPLNALRLMNSRKCGKTTTSSQKASKRVRNPCSCRRVCNA